jgi:serine/threonine protein kinase
MDTSHTDVAPGPSPVLRMPFHSLPVGTALNGRYQIEAQFGSSPFGVDYRVRDLADGRLAFVKILFPALVSSPEVQVKLLSEVQAAVHIQHENIAQTIGIFDARLSDTTTLYVVSECIEGQNLHEVLEKRRSTGTVFSPEEACRVVNHLCTAVEALGSDYYGGLTPHSIWSGSQGTKLADCGLGRTLGIHPELLAQMAPYRAPEIGVIQPDPRADVYALGSILFEMLTLQTVQGDQSLQIRPGLPTPLDGVVSTCLQKAPENRFSSSRALREALHRAVYGIESEELPQRDTPLAHVDVIAPGEPRPPRFKSPSRPPQPPPIAGPPRTSPPPAPPRAGVSSNSERKRIQRAGIKTSFNLDVALSAIDDSTERWLIQKDKLDFGPFNFRNIKEQIEFGKIVGEDIIIDTENGERRRVKDHPQLRDLVIEAERAQAEKRREAAQSSEQRRHQRRVVGLLGATLIAVVGVLGGGFLYGRRHHWFEQKIIKEVVHQNDLDFMKGVEISLKVDPPPAKPRGGKRRHSGRSGDFDEATRLGDASEEGNDESLDQAVVQRVMTQNFRVLVGCIGEERRRNSSLRNVEMDFIIRGTGSVSAVKVNGQTGTPIASCMFGKMQSVVFPKFNGQKTHASFSLALK